MGFFSASIKNPSTGINDITANGSQMVITDWSNYVNYADFCAGGSTTTIVLPVTASSYDDFYNLYQYLITAGTGAGNTGIISNYVALTKILTIPLVGTATTSSSVFEIGERGHLQEYFKDFRKVKILNPDNSSYLFSSLGDGDALTNPAALATLPISDTYNYTTGDGVYTITLYTAPTWDNTIAYKFINNVYVFYLGSIYKLLKDNTGTVPGTDITVWQLITDIETLPAKYRQQVKVAIICNIMACRDNMVVNVEKDNECGGCNNEKFLRTPAYQKVLKLDMAIVSIPINVYKGNWDLVQNTITMCRELCCCV